MAMTIDFSISFSHILKLFSRVSLAVLIQTSDGWADCHDKLPTMSVTGWSEKIFSAPWTDLPLFIREETNNRFDHDQDGWMSPQEQESVACQMSAILSDLAVPGDLVLPHGKLNWLGYLARQETISGYELKVFLGRIGRHWVENLIRSSAMDEAFKADLLTRLEHGRWSVSEAELASQEDLLGVDTSPISTLNKYLTLAYTLSELKLKAGAFFPDELEMVLRLFFEQKNLPWLASVSSDHPEIHALFNQVVMTSLGEPGMYRFYLLQGVPVTLRKGVPPVWYQPADQQTFVLLESDAYSVTSVAVAQMRKILRVECVKRGLFPLPRASSERGDQFVRTRESSISLLAFQEAIQARVNQLSQTFSVPEIAVVLSSQPLKEGSTAYLDRHEKKIWFSLELLQAVAREVGHNDFERHLNFLVIHEFLHWVQSHSADYEGAFRQYNSPGWAHLLFGEEGYRRFYLGQPTERDAQGLASEYVRAATSENSCQNWAVDPSFAQ